MHNTFFRWFLILIFSGFVFIAKPNNIHVGTPALINPSPFEGHVYIEFDLSWDNSWHNATNKDAAWIFIKYRRSGGEWEHAYLDTINSAHTVVNINGVEAAFDIGLTNINGINKGVGTFIYRQQMGSGTVNWQNVRIKWPYAENGLGYHEIVEVQVFAIEMVYVPQGPFIIGDGASFSRFHQGNNINMGYTVNNSPISFGNTAADLWATGAWDAPSGTLSSDYPTGYKAFYCMKYSITQGQYVAFLNTLSRQQQQTRTATDISAGTTNVNQVFVMSQSSVPLFRNGIRCNSSIPANAPIVFYCDLNNNGQMNEADDGAHIGCNYLSWADGVAYAAWAGLRPMSETEYEKACRGALAAVANEYAWGTAIINGATQLNNAGTSSEVANSGANCVFNNASGVQGPARVGIFASTISTREASGATYYGVMEMSGNLWERTISLGSASGRNFTGLHGEGILSPSGDAIINNWPGTNAIGSGFRGGHWKGTLHNAKTSGRDNASFESSGRNEMFGFRLIRSD